MYTHLYTARQIRRHICRSIHYDSIKYVIIILYVSLSITFTFHGDRWLDSVTQIDRCSDVMHQRDHASHYALLRQQLAQCLLPITEHDLVLTHVDELLQVRVQIL